MIRHMLRALRNGPYTEAPPPASLETAAQLERAAQARLGRSLALRHLDSGSCNGCELELQMLNSVLYDLEQLGLRFVASPRHADVLLITGPVTKNLLEAVLSTYHATPDPKFVVAIGDCAMNGGIFRGGYAVENGLAQIMPVDLVIPGCPPTPEAIMAGLHTLLIANSNTEELRMARHRR